MGLENSHLGLICGGNIDKDISRLHRNLGIYEGSARPPACCEGLTLRVDDWRHRQYPILGVVDDGVRRCVSNDRQIFCQMTIGLHRIRSG